MSCVGFLMSVHIDKGGKLVFHVGTSMGCIVLPKYSAVLGIVGGRYILCNKNETLLEFVSLVLEVMFICAFSSL